MERHAAQLADAFDEQDADLVGGDPLGFEGYAEQLERARADTARPEACAWGWAVIDGLHCALVVMDFAFMGGSMGAAVGEKIARAFDGARKRKLPVVVVTASGGARMQEGMVALVQMAKTAEARRRHAASGLVQITLLQSPTTGGVYASFASLADVLLATPGATIGFAGPRVVEDLTGTRPDPRTHSAEFAFEHGLIDAIVPGAEQRATISKLLRLFAGTAQIAGSLPSETSALPVRPPDQRASATEKLQLVRDPKRPKAPFLLDALLVTSFELRGDRTGATDDAHVVVRIGELEGTGRSVLAIGQDSSGDGRIRPQGYRKAVRAIELAGRVGLPVVTLIDTRGADPVPSSEGHGIAAAVARTFAALLACPSPTLAAVTGEGGSGGALAMAVCDHVLAWENSVFSVIAPEGAASILHRDPSRGPELAERLGITAEDLAELDIVDEIAGEPVGGAQADPRVAAEDLAGHITRAVEALCSVRESRRLRAREHRWRNAGSSWIQRIAR